MSSGALLNAEALILALLAVVYAVIAIFRAAYAEMNPVAASRLLAARGLTPREGESPGDLPPVVRTTFDTIHHVVLILAAAILLHALLAAEVERPFLSAILSLVAGTLAMQLGARALALSDPQRAFSACLAVIWVLFVPLRPVVWPVAWMIGKVRKVDRDRRAANGGDDAAEEVLEAFLDAGQKEGILEAEEGRLIRQVVEFHDSVVREVMTPRTEVVALPKGSSMADAMSVFAAERHSRLPIYRDHLDNVEGILTMRDLVAEWEKHPPGAPVDPLVRPAYFVPETKQVSVLLKELQARRIQLAVVVDEYGGTAGVVTIEDLLEELVGEIQDEHEHEELPIVAEPDGSYLARGSASLDDLRSAVGVDLEGEGFETVSGLIYSVLGRIPKSGETVDVNGLRLSVVEADDRRIEKVRVSRLVESRTP